jgi:putative FmdB family regulatory protein
MPTYQYRCTKCHYEFEEFQKISEPPIEKCPRCGRKTERVITGGAGFLLKGSGFYSTDYRPSSYKEDEKREKALEPAAEIKSGSKDKTKESAVKHPPATT